VNLSKGSLLALLGILLILSTLVILPFLQYVLVALLIAFALTPLQHRLEAYLSPVTSAFLLVVFTIIAFLVPAILVIAAIADDISQMMEEHDIQSLPLDEIEARIEDVTGRDVELGQEIASVGQDVGRTLFERTPEAVGRLTHFLIGIMLTLFLVYYLLKNGDDMLDWLIQMVPLPEDVQKDLYHEIDNTIWAVLVGHIFVSMVQGVLAGFGLLATGVPNAAFWTAVMVILALVPLIGSIPVWLGATVFLFLTDRPLLALGLFLYSAVIVGLTDDILRPYVVDRYAKLNPAVILLGTLGGAYAFGIMGLFFGPVVLGALKATVQVIFENWEQLDESGITD